MRYGIASVFQELTLLRSLSVQQNLLLTTGRAVPGAAWIGGPDGRSRPMSSVATTLTFPPDMPVRALPLGAQQMLEIARAVERRPKVLLLDEATSALGAHEVEWLVRLVQRLRAEGTIVLFISHRWDEIVRFSTRVAIMRNGELVGEADTATLSEAEAVRLMTGHSFEASFPQRPAAGNDVLLRARNLRSAVLRDINFDLHCGEVLGLGGLSGRDKVHCWRRCSVRMSCATARWRLAGQTLRMAGPAAAIRAGLAYVPQERKTEGLLMHKSISVNMTLAILRRLARAAGFVDRRREQALVLSAIERFHIDARSAQDLMQTLSGGNQQKVLLEKWLLTHPSVLLLNDVTRGVDIGTKLQIYRAIAECAAQGVAVILYSTDTLELVGLAHRVLVFKEGQVNESLQAEISPRRRSYAPRSCAEGPMRRIWPSVFRVEGNWPVLTFAALFVLDVALKGRFSRFDLQTLCVNVLPLVLISFGQFFVVLTRGIDLSLGPISSVAGASAALLLTQSMTTGFAVALLAGAAAGFCNGMLVVRFALPPIVVTLGSMSVWQGVALLILPNPGGDIPPELSELLNSDYGIPTALVSLVLIWLAAAWIMSTRFGLHLRAMGDDEAAARMSGVAVQRVKLAAYVLAGTTAALGGVTLAIATSSGSPTVGDDYILLSVATVVLGGVPLVGGAGGVLGVVMGALIVTIIGSLLYFANLSSFYQSIINGVILLAVVGSRPVRQWIGLQIGRLRHAG